jgi:hypothetical protein
MLRNSLWKNLQFDSTCVHKSGFFPSKGRPLKESKTILKIIISKRVYIVFLHVMIRFNYCVIILNS